MRSLWYRILCVVGALAVAGVAPALAAPQAGASPTAGGGPAGTSRGRAAVDKDAFAEETKVALLVGIGDYDRSLTGLSSLRYPVPDITAVASSLKKQGYQVSLLTDRSATAGAVRDAFRELTRAVDEGEGTFLFYFAGHGFQAAGENYLATSGVVAQDVTAQGLSLGEVQKLLHSTGAKRRIAFIDACRSDATRGGEPRTFKDLKASEGVRILYSTAPGDVSYEDEDLQHGVFSYFVARGLDGAAARNADGLITFDDLRVYVTREVRAYGVSKRAVQTPYQLGDSAGDFLLGRLLQSSAAGPPSGAATPVSPD